MVIIPRRKMSWFIPKADQQQIEHRQIPEMQSTDPGGKFAHAGNTLLLALDTPAQLRH
jgi:hypothetical protein